MQPKVKAAVYEWLAGIIIGVIPLGAHAVAYWSNTPLAGKDADWLSDILFVVISTSGASSVSVVNRLLNGKIKPSALASSAGVLSAATVALLVLAATLYGSAAVGHARPMAIWEAFGLLVGSLITSIYFELTLAAELAGLEQG